MKYEMIKVCLDHEKNFGFLSGLWCQLKTSIRGQNYHLYFEKNIILAPCEKFIEGESST